MSDIADVEAIEDKMEVTKRTTVRDAFAYEVAGPTTEEKLMAEFVGTFFVSFTVGVSATSRSHDPAVANGLMLAAQIYTFASVSGALLNPAVAVAVFLSGRNKIDGALCVCYAGAEMAGGLLGAIFAFAATSTTLCYDASNTKMDNAFSCFLLEVLYSGALVLVVLVAITSDDTPNHYFGFAIGACVLAATKVLDGFDQGALNPAVAIGMNMVNYFNKKSHRNPDFVAWMTYLLAPLLGACIASAIFWRTRLREYPNPKDLEQRE